MLLNGSSRFRHVLCHFLPLSPTLLSLSLSPCRVICTFYRQNLFQVFLPALLSYQRNDVQVGAGQRWRGRFGEAKRRNSSAISSDCCSPSDNFIWRAFRCHNNGTPHPAPLPRPLPNNLQALDALISKLACQLA